MRTTGAKLNEPESIANLDIPVDRSYDSEETEELDDLLEQAIAKAEEADRQYLATLLSHELGSLYYSTR